MGREENQYQRRNCNCDRDKSTYGKTTHRENYAVPDDDFYEMEDVRWNAASNQRSGGECSHRRVSSIEKETLSSFRQRACQFIDSDSDSETESSTLDECCSHCACSGVMKKAHDLLNYSPESNFLRKLKSQSERVHEIGCNHNRERDIHKNGCDHDKRRDINDTNCACGCRCYMSGILEDEQFEVDYSNFGNEILPSNVETTVKDKIDPVKKSSQEKISKDKIKKDEKIDKKKKKPGKPVKKPEKQIKPIQKPDKKDVVKKDKTKKDDDENVKPKIKPDDKKKLKPKVPHVSRPKIKSPPAKRKPREIRDVDACGKSEASLKRPRPNSCERCWKYASPARSPVNKPLQRYDPNYRRAHGESGEGDINPETKVWELFSPLGSVEQPPPVQQRPAVQQQNVPKLNSQGNKVKIQEVAKPRPRPQSHTSVRPPATEIENNWDSLDSTQYHEPPEKITVQKKPSNPPKRTTGPIKKKDPPLQKKGSKTTLKPSAVQTKPSSPLKDSCSSKIKIIDLDAQSGKHSHCLCSHRTDKTVPSENVFKPKPVERISSATFTVPRRERPTCHCKSADYRHRLDNPHTISSRYSNEAINRRPTSAHFPEENERERPPCHCSLNRHRHEESHKHRKRGKENAKKCCCKCHCGAQHCTKQKFIVNDRLFAEPVNTKPNFYESDSSEVLCDCGECKRRRRSLLRHCHKNGGNENVQKNEHSCGCKIGTNDNNSNNNNNHHHSKNNGETPKKYSVFYMTESGNNPLRDGSGVEVLVEEFTSRSKNKNSKDKKSSKDIETKIKNITQYRPDSMALRFQKGVTEKNKPPTSPRVLYF